MIKNFVIIALSITLGGSFLELNKIGREYRAIQLHPSIKVIDWPEELAPMLGYHATFTTTLDFKMHHDTLVVGFHHEYDSPTIISGNGDSIIHLGGSLVIDTTLFSKHINK